MTKLIASLGVAMLLLTGAAQAEMRLVMVEEEGCMWCARWNREIAPIYPKTSEGRAAPLERVNKARLPKDFNFQRPLFYTPTFVLMDSNREVGRIEGYPGEDFFWGLLARMITDAGGTLDPELTQ